MFTGLVSCVGSIVSLENGRLRLDTNSFPWSDPILLGESIAVSGCCLTVVEVNQTLLSFDVSPETLSRTRFGTVLPGAKVNIERAIAIGERLGGHFVQGHVDSLGMLISKTELDKGHWLLDFECDSKGSRYLVDKGSISIEGISLTVVEPTEARFSVAVIPQTIEHTNLGDLSPGSSVHIEYDVLAKHVEKLLKFNR